MVVLHPSSRPAAAPWPHDATFDGFGVRLGATSKTGSRLVGQNPPDQGGVAPQVFGEDAKNPVFGGVLSIRDLSRGMGQRRQRGDGTGRYWYMLNARGRAGYACVGPALTTYTPATRDSTIGVTRFFEIGGRLFALDGRYCLTGGTDGTGWTVSKDFGANKAATDVIVLQDNHAAATRYALVAMGDAEHFYYFDGATGTTTWTQHGTMFARAWAVDPLTLYRAESSNKLWELDLDADLTVEANWASATDRIGTRDNGITRMAVDAAGSLLICKGDDVYTLNPDGSTNRLFAERQFVPATTNGEALSRWLNDAYVTYGNATYRLTADGGLTQVGPELFRDNGSEVRGYLTAHAGTDYFLLGGLYNPDSGASYLCEYTGEAVAGRFGAPEPVWHGSITAAFSGKKVTAIHQSTLGAPSGHKMAYLGFSDGTIAKYVLACTPDPSDCTSEVFSTASSQVFYPRLSFNFPGQRKSLLAVVGEADNWSATTYGRLAIRTSGSASYANVSDPFAIGERPRVVFGSDQSCTYLDPCVTLTATASTASPRMTGLSIEYQLRTVPQEVLSAFVLAEDGLRARDGTPYRVGADEIRDRLTLLSQRDAGVTFVDPDGESHLVTLLTPSRTIAYDLNTRRPHDAVAVTLIERQATPAAEGLSALGLLTLQQMGAYSLTDLAGLG